VVTQIDNYDQVDVFVGLDVGKGEHHAVALDRTGKKLYDRALPNDEGKLRAVLTDLQKQGIVLLIVDQPATIGALPIAVAQAAGALVGYLPGLAMRRIADLHPGEAKTDARDAAIIAETARTMPHTLRSIQATDEQVAELAMLCGFDDDLAAQITQVGNRVRGLLTQIHPRAGTRHRAATGSPRDSRLAATVAVTGAVARSGREANRDADAETCAPQGPRLGLRDHHRARPAVRGRHWHQRGGARDPTPRCTAGNVAEAA